MILCRDKTEVGGRGVRLGGVCLSRKYIGRQEGRAGRVNNIHVKISDRS